MKLVGAIVIVLAAGCASHSSRMGGVPLAAGARERSLSLDALVFEHGREHAALPVVELSYRRGLRPGLDVGGKLHLVGGEGSLRFALAQRGRLSLGAVAGLGAGYEPVTNNTTDLLYLRALPRLVIELAGPAGGRGPDWIVALTPALSFTGPATMFAGVWEPARFILRPGAALANRWRLRSGRIVWLEATVAPAYAFVEGWLAPTFQAGVAIGF